MPWEEERKIDRERERESFLKVYLKDIEQCIFGADEMMKVTFIVKMRERKGDA